MGAVRWRVDDRRPTLFTRLYVLGMRLRRDKQAFEGEERTLRIARTKQRAGDAAPTLMTRFRCRIAEETKSGMTVWTVRSRRRRNPIARILYVHGGGYVHPLTADYWRLVRVLASTPAEVVVPAYPLAPDAQIDDVLPALLDVARSTSRADLPTVFMGDSAGGTLVLTLAMQIRREPDRAPNGVVCLCPWLNPKLDEPEVARLESSDPMLAESGLRAAGRWWAGSRSTSDPSVNPLEGDLDGLPPVHVLIGDHDILRPAVDELADRASRAQVELSILEVPAMFHVWMTRAIPEAGRTRRDLQRVVRSLAGH